MFLLITSIGLILGTAVLISATFKNIPLILRVINIIVGLITLAYLLFANLVADGQTTLLFPIPVAAVPILLLLTTYLFHYNFNFNKYINKKSPISPSVTSLTPSPSLPKTELTPVTTPSPQPVPAPPSQTTPPLPTFPLPQPRNYQAPAKPDTSEEKPKPFVLPDLF